MNPNIVEARERDFPQVLKESFDPQEQRIRVEALISDGVDAVVVNSDGSINVNVVDSITSTNTYQSYFNEVTSVAASVPTIIQVYTVPAMTQAFLERIDLAGTNIASYEILINDVVQDKRYTYFGSSLNLTCQFNSNTSSGYPLNAGDTVKTRVTHIRPFVGDFNSRIQVMEIP